MQSAIVLITMEENMGTTQLYVFFTTSLVSKLWAYRSLGPILRSSVGLHQDVLVLIIECGRTSATTEQQQASKANN